MENEEKRDNELQDDELEQAVGGEDGHGIRCTLCGDQMVITRTANGIGWYCSKCNNWG